MVVTRLGCFKYRTCRISMYYGSVVNHLNVVQSNASFIVQMCEQFIACLFEDGWNEVLVEGF